MIDNIIKKEQIARNYSSVLDSVELVNNLKLKTILTENEVDTLQRNKEHISHILSMTYWTTEDLTPLKTALI